MKKKKKFLMLVETHGDELWKFSTRANSIEKATENFQRQYLERWEEVNPHTEPEYIEIYEITKKITL